MSSRRLVVLGTASQAPTRYRNHNGYLLRWEGEGVLFDPGEGTQRQMLLAGESSASVRWVCVTHFHGDHCLGLPGVLQRASLDRVSHPVTVHYPAAGEEYFHRLRHASVFRDRADIRSSPVDAVGPEPARVADGDGFSLWAAPLDHDTPTVGWRLVEPDGRTMVAAELERRDIRGPAVGELVATGSIRSPVGRTVTVDEVSVARPGQKVAFVMDTRPCEAALRLAAGADLLVCESTFLEAAGEADMATEWGHLTAAGAARLAAEAGARRLVLTHFSQRHPDTRVFLDEARRHHPDVVAACDLSMIDLPPRRRV